MMQRPREQLILKHIPPRMSCVINENVESRAEKSDPENHIYEMIDEYEVNRNILKAPNHPVNADETSNSNLFQNLLRAEMIHQMQSCSKLGNNGYLSHLPQQKRMDIIQETALGLASAAYLEKWVFSITCEILDKRWWKITYSLERLHEQGISPEIGGKIVPTYRLHLPHDVSWENSRK